ncbi:PP2C family protein-serine/threonine phosphatase [Georgenia sp. SYP-B2076]|uniref:PP2C family protein-serine/threonine phosphatase n=1 Tax=Georgenia sp. SYP-B2076 TaxID=2495881 RepID=UPI000F8E42CA|nr:PP2C family protein-serine/threonine phosphatase [Georgenia sp. SYP-B2076]
MARDGGELEQRRLLGLARERADLSLEQLWRRYFALGGSAGLVEVEAYLSGLLPLPAQERDRLALAVNERIDEMTWRRGVPYSHTIRLPQPEDGFTGAAIRVVDGMHLAPPDRLAAVAAAAGAALGVRIVLYLVDYDQKRLYPVPGPGAEDRPPLGVDTSVAGRAFRLLETIGVETGGRARVWVPLVDGAERLGVMEAVLTEPGDPHDLALRRQLAWLSMLIGHLVVATTHYGDALDNVQRRRPRDAAAELVWQLLPPMTAGTDKLVLAGAVEPCYNVGGDAFDYALSETTAQLAIFDATGHSLDSGVVTAMALSAYRSARRNGGTLFDQAMAIDEIITGQVDSTGRFVTAVLAELDLGSGRLRYIAAGHPYPLLMRRKKVVKSLTGGRRPVFGMPARGVSVAEEILEPGDVLVLYTDGITEARDREGRFFGVDRLVDFLEREMSTAQPPPETVRRLVRNVLGYQNDVLQDDATILVARWADLSDQFSLQPRR